MKFYCDECEKEYEIGEKDLFPSSGTGIPYEEYLLFYAICPGCKELHVYEECTGNNKEIIPRDMKLRLMRKYAYLSEIYYQYYEALSELEKAKRECESIKEEIDYLKSIRPDRKRLFEDWETNEKVLKFIYNQKL